METQQQFENEVKGEIEKRFWRWDINERGIIQDFIFYELQEQRKMICDEMLAECDRTENEGGRVLIEKFRENL